MTTRSRSYRPARRRDDVRPRRALLHGALVAAVIAILVTVLLRAGSGLPFVGYKELRVDLPYAGSLRHGSAVDVAGVRVGKVLDKQARANGHALVTIQLDPGVDPLPSDTTARVRAQGLLGARFLELRPGTATSVLEEGDTIRGTEISNGLPEAIAGFDRRTRAAMGSSIRALGLGFANRGEESNAAIGDSPEVFENLTETATAILDRPGAAARLLPSVRSGMSALASAREDFARSWDPGTAALRPFVDRRDSVRATLTQAPPALSSAETGLGEGRRLLAAARALAVAGSAVLPQAPAGLRSATRLLRDARNPLRRTTPLLSNLRAAVPDVLDTTNALAPVLRPARAGLGDVRPLLVEVGRRRCDLDNFAENWRSMLGYGVAGGGRIGPLTSLRLEGIASNESLVGLGPAGQDVLLPDALVTRNPYPGYCAYSPGKTYGLDRIVPARKAR